MDAAALSRANGKQLTRMTSFEPAQALIRFVTTLVERSLQEGDVTPSESAGAPVAPVSLMPKTGNAESDRNANPEE